MYCTKAEHYFTQTPEKHLLHSSCPICAKILVGHKKRLTTAQFIDKAVVIHGNKYDYSEVLYLNNSTKVAVKCNTCQNKFFCHPNNHLTGKRGCPSCAKTGFDGSKEGTVYIMVSGNVTKLGITNLNPEQRRKDITRSYGDTFAVVHTWKCHGEVARKVESSVLRKLRKTYNSPSIKFDGSSECFYDLEVSELIELVEAELNS